MATLDVIIPPDWLGTPKFANRTELLAGRKQDRRELGLAIEPPFSCDARFGRTDKVFRDSHRRSGAFVRTPRQQELDLSPLQFHPRATCCGSPTKSALFARRLNDKRLESLKFEPCEIERLNDIPKVDQLTDWWKCPAPGYVADPANLRDSLRLQHAQLSKELGPVDPAKTRSPASVDERRLLREKRRQLADKVNHITHQLPDDYTRTDSDYVARATDLYPSERRVSREVGSPEAAWSLPVSPIKVPRKKARDAVENIVLEGTSQRTMLDQLKSCQVSAPRSLTPTLARVKNTNFAAPFSPIMTSIQGRDSVKDSIRCGGFY